MSKIQKLTVETLLHMLIDFLCIYCVMLEVTRLNNRIALALVAYNLMAFATQILFGYWIDSHKNKYLGVSGIIFCVILASLVISIGDYNNIAFIFITLFLLGLSNSMFHVGVGVNVIKSAKGKLTDLGIFISSGTLGVMFGRICALGTEFGTEIYTLILVVIMLTITLMLVYTSLLMNDSESENKHCVQSIHNIKHKEYIIVWVTFICIIARSATCWVCADIKINNKWIILSLLAFTGKFMGGILSDKLGVRNIAIITTLLAITTNIVSYIWSPLALVGVMCTNIMMPITLAVMISVFEDYLGFAFGMTTLALIIGALPTFKVGSVTSTISNTLIYVVVLVGAIVTIAKDEKEC